jgi:trigger factor
MEYKLEELSPVERKVVIDVAADEVNASLGATIALYRKDAKMDGFRQGKVPASVIEGRFRKQIYAEATQDLVNLHINEVMNELKLTPVSGINFDGGEIVRDQPFQYTVTFEVMPVVDLPDYTGFKARQEQVEVKDEEVQAVFDRIRNNLAETVPVETPRTAQDGDIAVVSFAAYEDGRLLDGVQADNFELVLGEGQSLEEFEEIVKTLQPTEKTSKEITFPKDFLNPEFAGRTVLMEVELHRLKNKVLPPLDDDLAKKAGGFPSLEKMREAITSSYSDSRTQLHKSVAQKKLLDQIMAGVEFPLPESMVVDQQQRMLKDLEARMDRQGKSLESLGKTHEELLETYRKDAEELIRVQIFLLAVADREGLEVSEQELDQFFMHQAAQSGENYNQLKRFYIENNLIFMVRDRLRADKAMELIYAKSEVELVSAAELAAEGAEKGEAGAEEGDKPVKKPAKKAAAKSDAEEAAPEEAAPEEAAPEEAAPEEAATKEAATKEAATKEDAPKKAAPKKAAADEKTAAPKKAVAKKAAPKKKAE